MFTLVRTRRSRLALLAVSTGFSLLLAVGTAGAQSGGTIAPGETTTTPPATAPAPAPAPATGSGQVFPIKAKHTFGDGLGAGRGHQGVDIFANCGAMEVAATSGIVVSAGFQGAMGNYLVIRSKKLRRDYVYMHLQSRPAVRKGQRVVAGQFVGAVGETGRATGCHLHFELWEGMWYRGGQPTDPMPSLQAWDAYS